MAWKASRAMLSRSVRVPFIICKATLISVRRRAGSTVSRGVSSGVPNSSMPRTHHEQIREVQSGFLRVQACRCLAPMDAFCEWETTPSNKEPWAFARGRAAVLAMAVFMAELVIERRT